LRKLIAIPLIVVAAAVISAQTRQEAAVAEWVRERAVRLQTVEAERGFSDMQPLKRIVGDARIVSLGEATHGTREFFQLKHRMLEFLATEMGFTIFSIEANLPEAYRLNDYVLTGAGDPRQLLRGMYFWTWDTEEVLDMILWMRRFNQSSGRRLQFTGFDMQTPTIAMENVRAFVTRYDPPSATAIARAIDEIRALTAAPTATFGVATGTFPLAVAAGKRVRYSGHLKTTAVTRGYAGLWWRVDGEPGVVLAFDNMQDRGPRGTTDWSRFEIDLPVAANARNINFGMLHTGDGSAWFDDLTIELDGVPYRNEAAFDLDFESPTIRGFVVGGGGYTVLLDQGQVRTGRQSLRMTYVGGPSPTAPPIDPARVTSTWKEVVRALEANRAAYRSSGASDREIEWATRNAIVVLQGVQMRTNEVSRDRSMAENVKWILDQSPGEKIVLWAHNGHVATGGFGFETMGVSLRQMFGENMVVFGFAFNQGAFQAVGPTTLSRFTVPPAPAGSLDAMLAEARIPVLAIDWRSPPLRGVVTEWLSAPHRTRTIGAVYREDIPDAFWANLRASDAFDATLFVERTTAARSNP
jgi:erythromycin esterase-like protein